MSEAVVTVVNAALHLAELVEHVCAANWGQVGDDQLSRYLCVTTPQHHTRRANDLVPTVFERAHVWRIPGERIARAATETKVVQTARTANATPHGRT
jgi:hypothetical protein